MRHFFASRNVHTRNGKLVTRGGVTKILSKLNADKAREIIASGVADVMAAAGESLPSATIREWCKRWLEVKEIENERTTHTRYEQAVRAWLEFLGSTADKNLEILTTDSFLKFRDHCASKSSVGSTNTNLRILRACLNSARQQGLIGSNPASLVKSLKERGESKRRAMKLEEIQRVLKVCANTDWRGLVLVGLYTGQRLGLRGEQAVAEALNEAADSGFRAFHDLEDEKIGNIDHVAVGSRGVFLIETKARRRRASRNGQAEHEVIFDGEALQFPTGKDTKPLDQAKRNAAWLSNYLTKKTGEPVRVEPLVVLPGWFVRFAEKGNFPVKAMNANYLVRFLQLQPENIEAAQVRRIIAALDEKCRTVEF